MTKNFDFSIVDSILEASGYKQQTIISILQDIQEHYHYLPQEVFPHLSEKLGMSEAAYNDGIAAMKHKLEDIIVFACCFSRFGDSPDEWFYAEDGNGVCLGFDTSVLSTLFMARKRPPTFTNGRHISHKKRRSATARAVAKSNFSR